MVFVKNKGLFVLSFFTLCFSFKINGMMMPVPEIMQTLQGDSENNTYTKDMTESVCVYLKKELLKKSKKVSSRFISLSEGGRYIERVRCNSDCSVCVMVVDCIDNDLKGEKKLFFFRLEDNRYVLTKQVVVEYVSFVNAYTLSLNRDSTRIISQMKCWGVGLGRLWDTRKFEEIANFEGEFLMFSPDGNFFMIEKNNSLYLCNSETGEKIREFPPHKFNSSGRREAWSPDGRFFILTSQKSFNNLWILDVESGKSQMFSHSFIINNEPKGFWGMFFNCLGNAVMSVSDAGAYLSSFKGLCDISQLYKVDLIELSASYLWNDCLFSFDDSRFILSFKELSRYNMNPLKFAFIGDVSTGKVIALIKGTRDMQQAFSLDGSYCVFSDSNNMRFFDSTTGDEIVSFRNSGKSRGVNMDKKGNKLYEIKLKTNFIGRHKGVYIDTWELFNENDLRTLEKIKNDLNDDQISLLHQLYRAKSQSSSVKEPFRKEIFNTLSADVKEMVTMYLLPSMLYRATSYIKSWWS
jgi:hypothetical protein